MLCHDTGLGFGRTSFYFQIFETLDGFQGTFPFSAFFHGSIDIHNIFQSYSQRMIKPGYFFILHVSYLFLPVIVGSLSAKSDRNSNQMNHENDSEISQKNSRTGSGQGSNTVTSPYLPMSCLCSHVCPLHFSLSLQASCVCFSVPHAQEHSFNISQILQHQLLMKDWFDFLGP